MPGGEIRFIAVIRWNASVQGARRERWKCETRGLERGEATALSECAGRAGLRALWCASRSQGNDRVGDAIRDTIKDTADSSRVINDGVRLPALQNGEPLKRPAIHDSRRHQVLARGKVRQLVQIVEDDDVRAIKVR